MIVGDKLQKLEELRLKYESLPYSRNQDKDNCINEFMYMFNQINGSNLPTYKFFVIISKMDNLLAK